MPFLIFRARSHERSQRHFRADFCVGVASRCLQQWKLNLELRSSTNATTVAFAKITGERGWRVGKKASLRRFLADLKIVSSWGEKKEKRRRIFGHPIAQATSYCLLPDPF